MFSFYILYKDTREVRESQAFIEIERGREKKNIASLHMRDNV